MLPPMNRLLNAPWLSPCSTGAASLRVLGRLPDARQADEEALWRAQELLAADPRNNELAFDRVQAGHSLAVVARGLANYPFGRNIE